MPLPINELTYWQTSISFRHNTRVWQTDRHTDIEIFLPHLKDDHLKSKIYIRWAWDHVEMSSRRVYQLSRVYNNNINEPKQRLTHACTTSITASTRGLRHLAKAARNDPTHTARVVYCTCRRRFKPRDRQTDWQTDRQTDRQTDTANIGKNSQHLMHSMQPKNSWPKSWTDYYGILYT